MMTGNDGALSIPSPTKGLTRPQGLGLTCMKAAFGLKTRPDFPIESEAEMSHQRLGFRWEKGGRAGVHWGIPCHTPWTLTSMCSSLLEPRARWYPAS